MCFNQPMTVSYVGFNTYLPPTDLVTSDQILMCSPSDRSFASTNIPMSGRNTVLSQDGSDVFTMMIKQESRDSNVYDAPTFIPDIFTRESPDGANSYVIDGPAMSRMSNISDLKHDEDQPGDLIRELVMSEDQSKYCLKRRKVNGLRSDKQKMNTEIVEHEKLQIQRKVKNNKIVGGERPPTRIIAVKQQRTGRTRPLSLSMDKINEAGKNNNNRKNCDKYSVNTRSTDRLPTLTSSEQERIIRIKKYEDDTEHANLRRTNLSRMRAEREKQRQPQGEVTIYESKRPQTVPDDFDYNNSEDQVNNNGSCIDEETSSCHENIESSTIENSNSSIESNSDIVKNDQNGLSFKRRKLRKWQGLSPMDKSNSKILGMNQVPISVECFIISRGWTIDQAQLNKAISRLDGINFVRIQMANTINKVVENIRPHNDVVLIHIGPNELTDACHSINSAESIPGRSERFYNINQSFKIYNCRLGWKHGLGVLSPHHHHL